MTHLPAGMLVTLLLLTGLADAKTLWQVGTPDGQNGEFALAPGHYTRFDEDGLFLVGRSDAKRDWPYVQPGPADGWAGGRQHTFSVIFGLKEAPASPCLLTLNFVDTQSQIPPRLRIAVNDLRIEKDTPRGGGDASVSGDPTKGRPHQIKLDIPASALRAGENHVDITTLTGSWVLWDSLSLDAPDGAELAAISQTLVDGIETAPSLVRRDGKLFQVITLSIRHFAEETDATICLDDRQIASQRLRTGNSRVELAVAPVEKASEHTINIRSADRLIASRKLTIQPVRQWVIYLLCHSHNDIGYTHLQPEVEKKQWANLDQAVEAAGKTAAYPEGAKFKWNVEVMWAVDSYLRQATPEKRQAFIDAVKSGSIDLDGLYGNELTGLCRPEEMLRLMDSAVRVSRQYKLPLESAMISDVPGYSWGIVPALAEAGVKYFSIGPNMSDRIGYTLETWGDKPFYWIGPSGDRKVLVWMTGRMGYGWFQWPDLKQANGRPIFEWLRQLEASGYPYDMVQARYTTGGDNGGADPRLCDYVKEWNETHAYPKLVIATASEMFRDFEKRYGDSIPKATGDFTPYWEDGAPSSALQTAINRNSAERLAQAEALLAMRNPRSYPANDYYAAWRNVILYDEHTWGAYNSISEPDIAFVKNQWKIKAAFAEDADRQSRQLLAQALGAAQPGDGIDVFNTSSFPRTDLVLVPRELSAGRDIVRDASGKTIPSQRLGTGELAFVATVPPLGSGGYTLAAGAPAPVGNAKADGATLANSLLSLRIDPKTGAVASFKSAAIDAELVDPSAAVALNDYVYLIGGDVSRAQRIAGPVKVTVKESGPLVASVLVESDAPGCNRLVRELRIVDGLDRVEILDLLDKKPVRQKEGVHIGFGFNVPQAEVRMDIPFAVVRPMKDQLPGACKNWFSVQRFIDVSNDRYGITLATPDSPLFEMGALTANLPASQPRAQNYLKKIATSPTIYAWVMNNHWHTNYKADQEGPTLFRFALRPHGPYRGEDAAQFGIACSQPLLVAAASGAGTAASRLTLDNPGVIVSAFKPSADGKALIVRLFAASGKAERVNVKFADPAPTSLHRSDLSEQALDKVEGPIDLPAWGLLTLRAELP